MISLKEKEKRINRAIIIVTILIACGIGLYFYFSYRKTYQLLVLEEVKGVISEKDRVSRNNPKAYYIKVTNSFTKNIPFGLIDELSIGDTFIKSKGKDYYTYLTKKAIIKELIPTPSFFGFPKDKRPYVEIIKRN